MKRPQLLLLSLCGSLIAGEPAHACIMWLPTNLEDVKYADLVLIGSIQNYKIIRDEKFRKEMLAGPKLAPNLRKIYEGSSGLLVDYAQFDIKITSVLAGKAPQKQITVTWRNSTFGEPAKMEIGPFLIALRDRNSPTPPLRGPSAFVKPAPGSAAFTILQAPCSGAFMFKESSEQAHQIRGILRKKRK